MLTNLLKHLHALEVVALRHTHAQEILKSLTTHGGSLQELDLRAPTPEAILKARPSVKGSISLDFFTKEDFHHLARHFTTLRNLTIDSDDWSFSSRNQTLCKALSLPRNLRRLRMDSYYKTKTNTIDHAAVVSHCYDTMVKVVNLLLQGKVGAPFEDIYVNVHTRHDVTKGDYTVKREVVLHWDGKVENGTPFIHCFPRLLPNNYPLRYEVAA